MRTKKNAISIRIPNLYRSRPLFVVFCMQNNVTSGTELQVCIGSQTSFMVFGVQNSDFSIRIANLYGSQTSPVILCMQNSVISTRITSLYGSQTSPVVLRMQNSVFCTRNINLYGSKPSSVAFAFKAAIFGSELQVSMDPSPHLWVCECKTASLDPELTPVSICPRPSPVV